MEQQAYYACFNYNNNNETIYLNSAKKILKMILICLKIYGNCLVIKDEKSRGLYQNELK